jgi:hypothetical protein
MAAWSARLLPIGVLGSGAVLLAWLHLHDAYDPS